MNPISNTAQTPTPKPDREIASPSANRDTRQRGTGSESGFGSVLRELAGAGKPAAPDGEVVKDEPDDAEHDALPAAELPSVAAGPASPVAAALANLLSIAGPPVLVAAADAGAPVQVEGRSGDAALIPAAGKLSIASPGSTAAPAGGTPAGSEPESGKGPLGSSDEIAGALRSATARVEVLARAVHFKPVGPGNALASDIAPADSAEPAAIEVSTKPAADVGSKPATQLDIEPATRVGAKSAAQLGIEPATPVSAKSAAEVAADARSANPQVARPELPVINAVAAMKLAPKIQSEPDLRHGAVTDPEVTTGPEKPVIIAPTQGHVVSGVERALLASVGERPEDKAVSSEPHDGTGAGLPAGSLPMIATAIKDELERATAAGSSARGQTDPTATSLPGGPLRMLKIQLRPEELGIVTVEMRLSNGQLETHLRASQPETAALLHRDTAILTDLLSHSTYQAEVVVGQARPAETASGPGGSPAQASPSFTDGGGRSANEGARQRQGEPRQASSPREGERTDEAVRPRDSGVYL